MIYGDNVNEEKCEWGMLIIIEKKLHKYPEKLVYICQQLYCKKWGRLLFKYL